jgi:hypothetical protein
MNERPWYEDLFGEVYLRAWASASTPHETARDAYPRISSAANSRS